MIRKLNLAGEELKFEMTNRTIFKIDEKYDNFSTVINGLMFGKNLYNNALKVLVCSCISREVTEEEFEQKLTAEQITQEIVPLATDLYLEDYRGIRESNSSDEDNKKK